MRKQLDFAACEIPDVDKKYKCEGILWLIGYLNKLETTER